MNGFLFRSLVCGVNPPKSIRAVCKFHDRSGIGLRAERIAGLGIWGLYKRQTPDKSVFNLASAAVASVAYFAFTLFPLQVMWSGLSMADFVDANPIYKLGGLVWFVGMLLFILFSLAGGIILQLLGAIVIKKIISIKV